MIMKYITLIMMLSFGLVLNAQNTNVQKETKTTTVTVNNGKEKKKMVKTENMDATQDVELEDADSNELNKNVKQSPVRVQSSTTVATDPDFNREIGQISNYTMNGQNYIFVTDKSGYRISSPTDKELGKLRKTSDNRYIFKTKEKTSIGYFDTYGNLIVESYDDVTDSVSKETYALVKN